MAGVAEEMLDGQHQRVEIPAHVRSAHKESPAEKDWKKKRISAESLLVSPPPPPPSTILSVKGLNTELGSLYDAEKHKKCGQILS